MYIYINCICIFLYWYTYLYYISIDICIRIYTYFYADLYTKLLVSATGLTHLLMCLCLYLFEYSKAYKWYTTETAGKFVIFLIRKFKIVFMSSKSILHSWPNCRQKNSYTYLLWEILFSILKIIIYDFTLIKMDFNKCIDWIWNNLNF